MGEASASGDRLEAFGRWLVRERELRGLARDEVIRATKIAPGVVEALESGDAARIPPRAYVVGYLRAYAAAATAVHNEGADNFSASLKCHDPNGELYQVNFSRQQVTISSYEDDAIRTRIETWADGVPALA